MPKSLVNVLHKAGEEAVKQTHQQLLNEMIEMCEGKINKKQAFLAPLKEEYNREYRLWHRGIKNATREALLKNFESGAKGYSLQELSCEIQTLSDLKSLLENKRDSL